MAERASRPSRVFRHTDQVHEALATSRSRPLRTTLLVTILVATLTGAAFGELLTLRSIVSDVEQQKKLGLYTLVVTPDPSLPGTIQAQECAGLNTVGGGIEAAGPIRFDPDLRIDSAPAARLAAFSTSSGGLLALTGRETDALAAAISPDLGERLFATTAGTFWISVAEPDGSRALLTTSVVDLGVRDSSRSTSLAVLGSPTGAADECWVSFSPAITEDVQVGIVAAFSGADNNLLARRAIADTELIPDLSERARTRTSRFGWLVAAGFVGLTLLLAGLARRTEVAVYRSLLDHRLPVVGLVHLGQMALVAIASAVAVAIAVAVARADEAALVVHAARQIGLAVVAVHALAALISLAMTTGSIHQTLKDWRHRRRR